MTTGMVSIENCPRDLNGILSIQRGIRYRLGIQTHMFKNEAEEQAFLGATDQVQAESLLAHLSQFDQGAVQQQAAVQPPPTQIALPPTQQPVTPGAMQQPMAMQMPAGPQMPAVQPPPAAMPQQVAAPPQMPAPAAPPAAPMMAPVVPAQVAMPTMQVPVATPQMPPQVMTTPAATVATPPPAGGKRPSTTTDPTNAGNAVVTPPNPKAAQFQQQLAKVIKGMSDTLGVHGESLDEVQEQLAGMTRVLAVILSTQLAMAEQGGIDRNMLAKCIKAMGDSAPVDFLELFTEAEESG